MREYDIYGNRIDNRTPIEKKRDFWRIIAYIIMVLDVLTIIATCFMGYAYTTVVINDNMCYKPIIYIYPEEETNIEVSLGYPEKITCSYPEYEESWNVLAKPDGTLIDSKTNRELYSLYWEGAGTIKARDNKGFVVKGENTAEFLEEKLEVLGLNYKEAQEFIIYWLPKMQENKYNYIRFASMEEINEYMPLEISEEPDTLIRVFMQYKPLDKYVEVEAQKLESVKREGFTVVEWGGTDLK